ncbi:left-right determination factor 2-like isoform X2 [Perognathus longimembris pacificus]|uniref:left-right determination factor 2-like isoform X2 n=1 Tax=Perognathus longimembris pacificus TaxID=214514 RepID=UPI0020193A04|nr:left-right determination factor 2-like isoform X2 [Perognathus longimembris pacificus]
MWPLWLCWALRGLLLASPGAALTERQVLGSLLQQLGLRRAPALGRAEVAGLAIPAPVRAQYVALLRQSHGDRSRGKRFSQHFREVAGRLLVSEPVPRAAGRRPERSARAQVSVEWLRVRDDGSNRTWLVDSRLVSVHDSGWKAFDVTEAVTFWQQLSRPRPPLLLQVSVRREPLGPGAAGAHRLVRFGAPGPAGAAQAAPQLELHTLDLRDYGAQGNCQPEAEAREAEGARCCRRETYLDLQGLRWAENWVLEPPGLLVYECVGRCRQPPEPLALRWPFLGPRQCVASETAALPVIVSAREGGRARPQVVSLPGLRVQRCGCASDGAPVPRRLQP